MSDYQLARQRRDRASDVLLAAQKGRDEAAAYLLKAEAEWAAATRDLRRFEIDPYARWSGRMDAELAEVTREQAQS